LNADCIVDLTLTKFAFKAYLEACRVLDLGEQEAALMRDVRDMLDHFPQYPTAESRRGTVFVDVSGEDPEVMYNTPNSLMTVFPGEDHGLHSPPEIRKVLANTWNNHRNEGCCYLVFLHLQGARLGLLDLEKFKRQINYCTMPNGTCTDLALDVGGRYHDTTRFDWIAGYGIWSENFALPVVINECLLQSYHGELRLFPNWTKANGDARFQTLRTVGAFLVSAEYKDGKVRWIRVTSEAGQQLEIVNPWPGQVVITRGSQKEIVQGERIQIATQRGDTLDLMEQPGN
jgi:alpha-L-fucosidase 2